MKSATDEPGFSHAPDDDETGSTQAISFVAFFFSAKGRINRAAFILGQVLAVNAFLVALAALGAIVGGIVWLTPFDPTRSWEEVSQVGIGGGLVGATVALIIGSCLTFWPTLALNVKRCHDRNRTGWFVLLAFLPLLSIWYLIEIVFLRGTEGNNYYGSDPLLESRKIIWPRAIWAAGCIVGILTVVTCASLYASQLEEASRTRMDTRFDAKDVISLDVSIPATLFPEGAQQIAAYQEIVKRIKAMPGIDSVGAISPDPLSGSPAFTILKKDQGGSSSEVQMSVRHNVIAGDYFRTKEIPLLRGRSFDSGEKGETEQVAVIDRELAQRGFPEGDPIGRRISFVGPDQKDRPVVICGVVGTVRHSPNAARIGELYVPLAQIPVSRMSVFVRAEGDHVRLFESMRQQILSVNKEIVCGDQ